MRVVKVRQPETGARAHASRGIIEGSHDERRASSRRIRRNDREKDTLRPEAPRSPKVSLFRNTPPESDDSRRVGDGGQR